MGAFSKYPYTNFQDLNLDWILAHIREIITDIESLETWKLQHEAQYQEIKNLYDQIVSGDFPLSIVNAFNRWMRENAVDLVGEIIKNVFFGLTDSGYFVAYIPDSWDDIIFNTTGWDYEDLPEVDYGHLILSY